MIYEINRSAIKLVPTEDFVRWLNDAERKSSDDDDPEPFCLDDICENCSVYLIPRMNEPEDSSAFLDERYLEVFKAELTSWFTDSELWPRDMSLRNFHRMFTVEFTEIIFDLVEEDLELIDAFDEDGEGSDGDEEKGD